MEHTFLMGKVAYRKVIRTAQKSQELVQYLIFSTWCTYEILIFTQAYDLFCLICINSLPMVTCVTVLCL